MLDVPMLVQWIVVVSLLTSGNKVPLVAPEQLCRKMATDLRFGEKIIGTIDGREYEVLFLQCVRMENGVVVEVLNGQDD